MKYDHTGYIFSMHRHKGSFKILLEKFKIPTIQTSTFFAKQLCNYNTSILSARGKVIVEKSVEILLGVVYGLSKTF
jgi:CelD/BcsL family acetyltransferase involved in cellulose biosynthesis